MHDNIKGSCRLYLELLQRFGNDWLAGCLLLAQRQEALDGLLEGLSLHVEVGRLQDHQQ